MYVVLENTEFNTDKVITYLINIAKQAIKGKIRNLYVVKYSFRNFKESAIMIDVKGKKVVRMACFSLS